MKNPAGEAVRREAEDESVGSGRDAEQPSDGNHS
jgi:hypothetical protein